MAEATGQKTLDDLLADSPKNWGRWGDDDEIGALNFLDAGEVLRGVAARQAGQGLHAAACRWATPAATRCGPGAPARCAS